MSFRLVRVRSGALAAVKPAEPLTSPEQHEDGANQPPMTGGCPYNELVVKVARVRSAVVPTEVYFEGGYDCE